MDWKEFIDDLENEVILYSMEQLNNCPESDIKSITEEIMGHIMFLFTMLRKVKNMIERINKKRNKKTEDDLLLDENFISVFSEKFLEEIGINDWANYEKCFFVYPGKNDKALEWIDKNKDNPLYEVRKIQKCDYVVLKK